MKRLLPILFCLPILLVACSSTSQKPELGKLEEKTKWGISFGTIANAPINPDAQNDVVLRKAIDGSPQTYWQSLMDAHAGMYIDLDFNSLRTIKGIILDSSYERFSEDYPHGWLIQGATAPGAWQELARDYKPKLIDGKVRLDFNPTSVQYLRIQLLGGKPYKWWSICEIDLVE
jgi:hypothetical protein